VHLGEFLKKCSVNFDPKYKQKCYKLPVKVSDEELVVYLWYLKTLIRCSLKGLPERYVSVAVRKKTPTCPGCYSALMEMSYALCAF